jgi:tetratricopeptide (TPR) repeat protein
MRKFVYCILAFCCLAGGGAIARASYRAWKQEHLVKQANDFLFNSDTTNAVLCLQQALLVNPSNIKACQLFASMAEKAGSRNAAYWRRRVVELEPKVMQHRIDWAKTCLVLGDLTTANEALRSVDEAGKKSPEYYKALGSLAWGLNQYPAAESNFAQALRLEPNNAVSQMDLAIIRLVTDDGAKANVARANLEALRTNPVVRLDALRQLTQDAARNNLFHKAIAYANELQQDSKCRFDDRLLYLDALYQANSTELESCLPSLQNLAATNSAYAYSVVGWMAAHSLTKQALSWARSLSPSVQNSPPLPLVTAECFASVRDWTTLDSMLTQQDWREMDYLRHLLKAISLRAQGNGLAASVEWRSALKISSKHLEALNDLARRTSAWHWGPELDQALWAIVDNFPNEKGAFLLLYDRLFEAGNTAALHTLLAKVLEFVPSNLELKNNLAMVSMLVDARNQHGHDLAREVFDANPHNPSYLSTYAYSLFCQRKNAEAIKLLESLKPDQLEEPGVAAYYGLILAGSGDRTHARHYLERGREARLLPEERSLLTKAEE